MAGDDLIASYARELSDRFSGRAGAVVAEALDHLSESVDERIARGAAPDDAAREAIAAFGTPSEVAESFIASDVGLPTRFTRGAGLAAVLGAGLVAAGLAVLFASIIAEWDHPWEGIPRTLGNIGSGGLVAGVLLSGVGAVGMLRRQGHVSGWASVAVAFLGIAAITALAPWFVWLWVTALASGASILTARLRRADLAPRRAATRAGLGAICAAGVPWLLVASHSIRVWDPDADLLRASVALGLLIWASGVGALGWWLLWEMPAPFSASAQIDRPRVGGGAQALSHVTTVTVGEPSGSARTSTRATLAGPARSARSA